MKVKLSKGVLQRRGRQIGMISVITVLFAFFQNCTMSSLAGKAGDQSSTNGVAAPGLLGVSPTSVQMAWTGVATSTSYNIYNMNQGSQSILSTVFTQATINQLTANTDYVFSVRGSRGTGNFLTDALGTYEATTWPLFSAVTFTVAGLNDSSQSITWTYAPWTTTTLAATQNAQQSSNISCSFIPVAAGTDPMTVNPTTPGSGIVPVKVTGKLFDQRLIVPLGSLDNSLTYAAQCTAKFVDNTSSASTQNFLVTPTQIVNSCASTALVGTSYSCTPNITIPSRSEYAAVTIGLDASNTCTWAQISGNALQSNGSLTAAALGTCNLAYRYSIPDINYTSPVIAKTVTVSVPSAYQVFPSFAVRAMSGAIAFPHLYATISGAPDTRAMVRSDMISDFGYGSSFFAGGNTPFPVFNPSSPAIVSTFFYGFPVAATVNGSTPTGYSLDAVRPTWQSTTPAVEGFMRGNLVIPNATITNANFISLTGSTSSTSLFTFLANPYTYDGGSSFAPAALSYYLNTISDRDVIGNPVSNVWNGNVFQQSAVTFNIPNATKISSFIPPTGVNGQTTLFANADATKTVTGLVSSSANNTLFYVTNCQNSPTIYPNPSACSGTPAPPTTIACFGDVIVQAPMLLVNPSFVTDSKGCRLHATGTIFVQGTINTLNSDGTINAAPVEIMSSRAVIFGFSNSSLGVTGSGTRSSGQGGILDQTVANGTNNPYLTSSASGPGAASAAINAIALDAQVVNLKTNDSSDALAIGTTTYNHVVACAPYVFSNYSGVFTGSITAEVVAFPHLNFAADPTLVGVTPFPLFTGSNAPLIVSQ